MKNHKDFRRNFGLLMRASRGGSSNCAAERASIDNLKTDNFK